MPVLWRDPQCGEIVTHRLDQTEAIPCKSGHPVAPTIARAALAVHTQPGGSTSRSYEPPRVYARREVNAHNSKYAARLKKRKPSVPKEPPADYEPGSDPSRAE